MVCGRKGRVAGIKQFVGRQVRECTVEVIPGDSYSYSYRAAAGVVTLAGEGAPQFPCGQGVGPRQSR